MPEPEFQRTIGSVASLEGTGLFWNKHASVTLRPAAPDTGILFRRIDLPAAPGRRLRIENLVERGRHTTLSVGQGEVHVLEHLLAAVGGLGIDNLVVDVDADELPCLDGSALPYVEALTKACIVEQNRLKKRLALSRAVEVRSGEASLAAMPSEEGLHVQYTLDYGGRFLPRQTIEVEVTEETFVRQIAPARSYVLRPEIEVFLRQGLGGGATPENTLVVEEDGAIATKLRFPDECIRHKVLDLLGDLQVLGGRLVADLVGHRSGHRLNVELARKIARAFASNV